MDKFIDNDSSNNGGFRSKFQERLKRIKLFRTKKWIVFKGNNRDNDKKNTYDRNEFVKEVVNNIRSSSKDRGYARGRGIVFASKEDRVNDRVLTSNGFSVKGRVSREKKRVEQDNLEDILLNIKDNKPKFRRNKRVGFDFGVKKGYIKDISVDKKKELIDDLGVEIINKIKGNFEDKLDEIEVLMSELYLISKKQDDEVELKKVKDIKKRIDELIERINELIGQYNLYKKNYYIDNVIGIDDNIIVDDIIAYRDMLGSIEDEKEFVKGIKVLDEFRSLYSNLVMVRDEVVRVQVDNEKKIDEFDIRDKKYDEIKLEMINALDIEKKCALEIERQNECFRNLMSKVSKINREEYVTMHLRGLGEMLGSTLRFMGLMFISPFTGMIPGIARHTMASRRMIANAYRHIHLEEVRHVRYEAENYESEINNYINDAGYTEALLEDTIRDVDRFKSEFMSIYNSNIPGYEDTLKKLDKIEAKLLRNQNKVLLVKQNLKRSKKLNEEKLVRVKEMNDKAKAA